MQILLGILLPAMFILVLLLKATEYAKKGSGKFGEMVVAGVKAVGGLAVAGAAGGVALGALAGRQGLGWGLASASRQEGAKNYGNARFAYNEELEKWKQHGKKDGEPEPEWKKFAEQYKEKNKVQFGGLDFIGGKVNASQKISGSVDHARHEMDEVREKAGLKGVEDRFLSGVEQEKLESTFVKTQSSQIEKDLTRGYDARGKMYDINGHETTNKEESVSASRFKTNNREDVTNEVLTDDRYKDNNGGLNDLGKKKVEDELTTRFGQLLKDLTPAVAKHKFEHEKELAKQSVGMGTRVLSRSTSGTYDIRNLSILKTDKREGLGARGTLALISAVATGIKLGLKKTTGADIGKPNGDILPDLGHTINEALKAIKLNVKIESDGGGHGDSHGGAAHAHAPDDSHGGGHH